MPNALARILLVEDDPSIRLSMSAILSESGYTLRTAEDGFSALREIRHGMPDMLLSDLYMPGMTGFELLSVVRLRFPAIRTIAMSGAFDGDEVPTGIVADAFYPKGGGAETLLRILLTLSQAERNCTRPSSATAPLWVYRGVSESSPAASITLACPECLRTSSQTLHDSAGQIQITECTYCHWPIHFAIARSFDKHLLPIRQVISTMAEPVLIPVTQCFY
ncbi:MAG: response regulator [Terracidiphilus sp.]|nr:response regulator [Terracidiphilus sp.]